MTSIHFLTNPIDLPHLQLPNSGSETNSSDGSSTGGTCTPCGDDMMNNDNNSADEGSTYSSISSISGKIEKPEIMTGSKGKHRQRKRKQRSGPSCDHCRSRKVKCDASILILEHQDISLEELHILGDNTLGVRPIDYDYQNNPIYLMPGNSEWKMVKTTLDNSISNTKKSKDGYKYIKYKNCANCVNKDLNCKFSKGFTRIHSTLLTNGVKK